MIIIDQWWKILLIVLYEAARIRFLCFKPDNMIFYRNFSFTFHTTMFISFPFRVVLMVEIILSQFEIDDNSFES